MINTKTLSIPAGIILLLLIASCATTSPIAVPTVVPIASPIPTLPQVQPTHTNVPSTATSEAPEIPTPQATPIVAETLEQEMDVQWVDGIYDVGDWSPTRNEIFAISEGDNPKEIVVGRFAAPDFRKQEIPIPVEKPNPNSAFECPFGNFLWSRDGSHAFFSGPISKPIHSYLERCSLWMVEHDGSRPRRYLPEVYGRGLKAEGWIGDHSLALNGYREGVRIFDLLTGQTVNAVFYRASTRPLFTHDYMVGTNNDFVRPGVLALGHREEPIDYGALLRGEYEIGEEKKYAIFPPTQQPGSMVLTILLDTLPATNKALLYRQEVKIDLKDPNIMHAYDKLILWDIDRNITTPLISGINGRLSPDQKTLAYLTFCPVVFEQKNKPTEESNLSPKGHDCLQLLDLSSNTQFLSAPVVSLQDDLLYELYHFGANFSPDGRYLAFLSDQELELDENGWPKKTEYRPTANKKTFIHILDLINKKLIWSTAAARPLPHGLDYDFSLDKFLPIWSPKGNQFVYLDEHEGLRIVNVSDGSNNLVVGKIEKGNSYDLQPKFQWSFDGSFLILEKPAPGNTFHYKIGFLKAP